MIPAFKCKDSWTEWEKAVTSGVLKKSQVSEGVFKDLVGYNEACIFFKGRPAFKIEDD